MNIVDKIIAESRFDSSNLKKVNDTTYINKNEITQRYTLFNIQSDNHIVQKHISFDDVSSILKFDKL